MSTDPMTGLNLEKLQEAMASLDNPYALKSKLYNTDDILEMLGDPVTEPSGTLTHKVDSRDEGELTTEGKIPWWLPLWGNSQQRPRDLFSSPGPGMNPICRGFNTIIAGGEKSMYGCVIGGTHPVLFRHAITILANVPLDVTEVKLTATDNKGVDYAICTIGF